MDVPSAVALVLQGSGSQFVAGGTSQVDLMKDSKVIEVTDFLDLPAYDAVLAYVALGPPD